MTRHQGFDVRIAPGVERSILALALRPGQAADEARHIREALLLLASSGTRANGAKKLRSLDLWEIRAGRHRLFFCLVPRTSRIALGAMTVKASRRIRMKRLKDIERRVHLWRDALGSDR